MYYINYKIISLDYTIFVYYTDYNIKDNLTRVISEYIWN